MDNFTIFYTFSKIFAGDSPQVCFPMMKFLPEVSFPFHELKHPSQRVSMLASMSATKRKTVD